ncbi:3-phosphoserine/phosphohydroxythreonine transaminase [Marinicella gelatinilytica]|uniref:3-phosphoserine/phosphohydroxythreonine transaminase n=1 Tax=Marinicella gelatinilytica TaxID=2996017 RepID=UPI002260F5B3|nr:3-phosphoserine/phosphohydroxythreonine transaminase [Marinicella gelatinilytica]MCX7544862.1 3-phosphoserine/phosphohydroxythreonine transaminase [Marinicella gelatinilytica]
MSIYNFSAGPAALPPGVKKQLKNELDDWRGTGTSVMEVSHRSPEFKALMADNESLLRSLLNISDDYAILLVPGGARLQYAMLPMNLSAPNRSTVYHVNGYWGFLAYQEAQKFSQVKTTNKPPTAPYQPQHSLGDYRVKDIDSSADYFHYTSNETLEGIQWHHLPDSNGLPLCCDMTSDIMTREIKVDDFAMIYASAQKNLGIAGLTLVIIRKDMLGKHQNNIPTLMDYATFEQHGSAYNTPPTFVWYMMYLVLQWYQQQGGVKTMQQLNQAKANKLYDFIDNSDFYSNRVDSAIRSEVNVPFWLADDKLNEQFLADSNDAGLKALKGHKAVGGMRASIYNAVPMAAIDALIEFMETFEKQHA